MSYCRWSSMDFSCDIYAYANMFGGYTVHIAANRVVGDIPKLQNIVASSAEEFQAAYLAQMDFLMKAERRPIDLPYAGETFQFESLRHLKQALIVLRKIGYIFPDSAIESIEEEMAEEKD